MSNGRLITPLRALKYGLTLVAKEKGELPVLETCREIMKEAYEHYRAGRMREGYFKMQEMEKLIKTLPSMWKECWNISQTSPYCI